MPDEQLVDRLAALPALAQIPRAELAWIVAHGRYEAFEAGTVMAPQGQRIETMWILLSGRIVVQVDRGAGPRRVIEWRAGEVSGMLPYSRMTGPPGHNYFEESSELVTVHEEHFREMVHLCPVFSALTVHVMLDRARRFNASDLHDEKMVSLGKLAAGLAHELNNPASATVRASKLLRASLAESEAASRAFGALALTDAQVAVIDQTQGTCLLEPSGTVLSPIQQADREDEISAWLVQHHADSSYAPALAGTSLTRDMLHTLAGSIPEDALEATVQWIAARCVTHALALDIERAATRIHELVATVKQFTYMDNRAGPESVDAANGLRETIRVLASKAKGKGAAITLDVQPGLPRARANGGELNQVWLNLLDNALDAVSESGTINVSVRAELDRVVVRIVDDGSGIPENVQTHIFDAFFTTKPPGQGTGLGLDISRRLVRQYHGDISVESRPGRTEFRVSLLIEKAADEQTDDRAPSTGP